MKNDEVREQLTTRLGQLTRRADQIGADLRGSLERDSEEQASQLENAEVLEGLDEMTLAEVSEIRGPLRRRDDGTYGVCVSCRQPIGAARLAAAPSTPTCVACAARSGAGAS